MPIGHTAETGAAVSYVGHIRFVALLLVVHGAVLLLASLTASAFGLFFLNAPASFFDDNETTAQMILVWMYLGVGLLLLPIALLQLVAGIRNLGLRNRKLGIVALCSGMLTVFTFYCAPTSIALAIYGLIVLLHPSVQEAFKMRSGGTSKEDILAALT